MDTDNNGMVGYIGNKNYKEFLASCVPKNIY